MKNKTLANSYLTSFCMELAMLLQSGTALSDGVLMMLDDEQDKDGKTVLQSLLVTLDKGEPLSAALKGSGYFPQYMTSMVEVGEKTGRLVETLKALSEHYDRQERLAVAIRNAVLYPAILLILMVAVVLILIIRVLPIFNDVFNRLGTQMSPLAMNLMRFGGWLGDVSAAIAAAGCAVLVIALVMWLVPGIRQSAARAFKDKWGSRGIFGGIASSRFTSAMTLAITSGFDAERAVEMASSVSGGSKAVDKKHELCMELLRSGSSLPEAMRRAGILSARDSRMLQLGSRNGMTDAAMAEIARRSARNVQDGIDRIVGGIEPTLVIVTSVMVGVILLSVMLPLMGIMTSIG